jgi:iron complex outermembrane receptor protein
MSRLTGGITIGLSLAWTTILSGLPALARAAATVAATADAAVDESNTLEQIVVTAQKRGPENVQNVPIAISVITSKTIEDAHTVDLQALSGSIPDVQIGHFENTPTSATFSIRGMSVVDPDPYAGQTVTVVMDGVPLVFNMISLPDLFDIDRVEVLKGPQGTLFGANTIGGVINIVTEQPTGDYSGKAEVTYGDYNRIDGNFAANFPISDTLAGKVSLMHHSQDGYVTNIVTGGSAGNQNDTDGRVYLKWTPNDSFNATLIQEFDVLRDGSPYTANGSLPGEALYVPAGTVFPNSVLPMYQSPCMPAGSICRAPSTYYTASSGVPDQEYVEIADTTLTMNWASPIGDLVSITGYRRFNDNNYTDQDGTPAFLNATQRVTGAYQISEELRDGLKPLDKLQVLVGAFVLYSHYNQEQNDLIQFAAPGLQQIGLQNETTRSENVFVQSYYDLTDKWQFQSGLRGTSETTEMSANVLYFDHPSGTSEFTGGVPAAGTFGANGERTWNNAGGKIGFNYKWNQDVMSYVYYARGFKSGGFTGRLSQPTDIGPYNPEYVDTIEGGLKADWLDHTLRSNVAIFYNKYHDLQLTEIYFAKNAQGVLVNGNSIVNAAQAKTQGIELDFHWTPIANLKFNLSYAYLDAVYTDFNYRATTTETVNLDGKPLEYAPKNSASGGFAYAVPIASGKLTLGIQDRYTGSDFTFEIVQSPRATVQATNFIDGTLDYSPEDGRWSVGIWVRDLANKHYISYALDIPGTEGQVSYDPPREFGATIRYKW